VTGALASALGKARSAGQLGRHLADALGIRWSWPVSSGRAALALLFEVLHRLEPTRNEVVIPAYTSASVPSAIARAGLRARLVDLAPRSFQPDSNRLAGVVGPRTLAIVATHLLGYPLDLRPLRAVAESAGATLIDDAAQALGARFQGRAVGSGGAVGILSFGGGMPLGALGGGAILCDEPQLIAVIGKAVTALPPTRLHTTAATALVAAVYTPLLRPEIYWFPARLPFLKKRTGEYDPMFLIQRLDGFRIGLILRGLARLEEINEARRRAAERLTQALFRLPRVVTLPPPPNSETIYLRFPILLPSADLRDQALTALRGAGIGASCLYPEPLTAIPALRRLSPDAESPFPEAAWLAKHLLCLPTYPYVGEPVIEKTVATLTAVLARSGERSGRRAASA
jgi:dTDP-4-amino-4,6-dideoxygalactose transaminase